MDLKAYGTLLSAGASMLRSKTEQTRNFLILIRLKMNSQGVAALSEQELAES